MKISSYRNIFISSLVWLIILMLTSSNVYAHPGRTDSDGCHTCKTNCEKWGLSYGEYHCHNSGGSSNNYYSNNSSEDNSFKFNYNNNGYNQNNRRENLINLSYIDLIVEVNGDEYYINGGEEIEVNSTEFNLRYRLNTSIASVSINRPYVIEEGTNAITFTLSNSGYTEDRTIYIIVKPKENWLSSNWVLLISVATISVISFVSGKYSNKNTSTKK